MNHASNAPPPRKAPRLTGADRRFIAQARALAAAGAGGHDGLRGHLTGRGLMEPGEYEDREIYPFALGVARNLLDGLADLAERLGGAP